MKALTVPDPRQSNVPVGWFESVAPTVGEMSWDELDDAEGQIKAVASYIESFGGDSLEFEKAMRLVECRRGVLLGVNVKAGERTDLNRTTHGTVDITKQTASRYRKIARYWDEVVWPHLLACKNRHQVSQTRTIGLIDRHRARLDAASERTRPIEERLTLIHSDIREAAIEPGSVDVVITDPPYPAEHVECWSWLGEFADSALKAGGSLVAMSGQSYLPDVLGRLSEHLEYHWTCAYLTPGGQSVQLWDRHVNTFWKPLLWFTKGKYDGVWVGDVCRSKPNDNDKEFHDWGQSESGMADVVRRFSKPADVVCDPFCGGGTTLAVALDLGRSAVGIDEREDAIDTIRKRLVA